MAGEGNLRPFTQESVEEAREAGRKGGLASVAVRRKRKSMREALKTALSCQIPKGSELYKGLVATMEAMGIEGEPTVQDIITLGMIKKASKSPKAAEFVRDTIGEKPIETFEDKTPQSPYTLGVLPVELVQKAKAEHDARQLLNNQQ